jgi:Rieske Fe-S protein
MSDIVKARKAGGYVRKPRTYAADRVCSHQGCETRLSTYNSRPTCRAHTPVRFPRVRGRVTPSEA